MIYHPSKYLGGTEVLFSRVIDILIQQGYKDINVIDYSDGVLSSKFKNDNVTYHDIYGDIKKELLENVTLIASAKNISRVLSLCQSNSVSNIKPLFWLLHPSELYAGYVIGSTGIKKIFGYSFLRKMLTFLPGFGSFKKNISSLCNNSNLCVMDESCLAESSWVLNQKLDSSSILPLITNLDSNVTPASIVGHGQYTTSSLLIISRLDDFKIHGIYKLLSDIKLFYHGERRFDIHLVGDGQYRDEVLKMSKEIDNINFIFHGYVENNLIKELFAKHEFDLCFAMGTAALESASRGIPTVLLPATDKPITDRNDVYKYIGSEGDSSLAEYLDTPFEKGNNHNLFDIITSNDQDRPARIEHVREFFSTQYSKAVTCKGFLNALEKTKSINVKEFDSSFFAKLYIKLRDKKRCKSGV